MRTGFTPELEMECRRPDSRVRTFIDAEIEVASDVRRRRAQWKAADGVVLRAHDFPSSNALTAAGQTTVLTLANAPAGNALYEVHWSVQITPVIPGAGTNTHVVVVAIETRPAAGAWTERATIRFESLRTAGQSGAIVRWPHERELVRVVGMTSTHELRIRVKSASGPGGWAFVVHGFNASDGDPQTTPVRTAVAIASSSVANPTVITTVEAHDLQTFDLVQIADHTGATPNLNGVHRVTVTGPKTFTIPVNVTVAGTGGTEKQVVPGVSYHTGPQVDFGADGGVARARP
jgi:hypothetical protein